MWIDWAEGVLRGIGAPVDQTNIDTLWAWSGAESLPRDRMSWNNPLNASWYMPGAEPMNWIPVWAYASERDGIAATINTLLGGPGWPNPPPPYYYPVILDHLRRSVPRGSWQDACPNLGTWGTGCGWLNYVYGVAPGALEADMLSDERTALFQLRDAFLGNPPEVGVAYLGFFRDLKTELDALKQAGSAAGLTQQEVQDAVVAAIRSVSFKAA